MSDAYCYQNKQILLQYNSVSAHIRHGYGVAFHKSNHIVNWLVHSQLSEGPLVRGLVLGLGYGHPNTSKLQKKLTSPKVFREVLSNPNPNPNPKPKPNNWNLGQVNPRITGRTPDGYLLCRDAIAVTNKAAVVAAVTFRSVNARLAGRSSVAWVARWALRTLRAGNVVHSYKQQVKANT